MLTRILERIVHERIHMPSHVSARAHQGYHQRFARTARAILADIIAASTLIRRVTGGLTSSRSHA